MWQVARKQPIRIATSISALLCVGVITLWIRSQTHWDEFSLYAPPHTFFLNSMGGELGLKWSTDQFTGGEVFWRADRNALQHRTIPANGASSLSQDVRLRFPGFGVDAYNQIHLFSVQSGTASTRERVVVAPHWFVCIVFAVLPGWRLKRRLFRRDMAGLCPKCGYDLRATPQRCPECGWVMECESSGAGRTRQAFGTAGPA